MPNPRCSPSGHQSLQPASPQSSTLAHKPRYATAHTHARTSFFGLLAERGSAARALLALPPSPSLAAFRLAGLGVAGPAFFATCHPKGAGAVS